ATTNIDFKTTRSPDTRVSVGGTNFSQGQSLLRRIFIIAHDEATSSIDFVTDSKIQTTIRGEFTDSLLLTDESVLAHRLWTVIDYDRLIVLDKGQKKGSIFGDMCLNSGSFSELEALA
ncbi:hypothetical protein BD779DRAFT_1412910, partial [Infundibulicybe gibba]